MEVILKNIKLYNISTAEVSNNLLTNPTIIGFFTVLGGASAFFGLPIMIGQIIIALYPPQQKPVSVNHLEEDISRGNLKILIDIATPTIPLLNITSKILPLSYVKYLNEQLSEETRSFKKILREFQIRCHSCKKAAVWLEKAMKENLASQAVETALYATYSKNKSYISYSSGQKELLSKQIENYLNLVCKCLKDCQFNLLTQTKLDPLVTVDFYQEVFNYITQDKAKDLQDVAIKEIENCFKTLISRISVRKP